MEIQECALTPRLRQRNRWNPGNNMTGKYTERIKEYCATSGFEIPAGFHRRAASRYVVIDLESTPPKLVAKTWFKQEDVAYYLQNLAPGKRVQVLDFKERQVLLWEGGKTLAHGPAF